MVTAIPRAGRIAASVLLLAAFAAGPAQAERFRWAGQTDPSTMDPHATNIAPVLGFLNNVYEGLVRRGKDMALEPALAERWEPLGAEGWRFHLRRGVAFHNGEGFDADDVVFSYRRAASEQSDVRSFFATVTDVRRVDDFTVDFLTSVANPLFPDGIANFMILDQGWAEANGAEEPARDRETFATRNANGTGPFKVTVREADVRTVLAPHGRWWDRVEHNITEAEFRPITSAATAVAALLSGEVDFIEPVPLQDVPRIEATPGFTIHRGVESRVIFFGFEHEADALRYSDLASGNPFQDARVRQAVYHAINADAIVDRIMRRNAQTAGLLISPTVRGFRAGLNRRLAYDPERARALLARPAIRTASHSACAAPTTAISTTRRSAPPPSACWRRSG